MAIEGNDLSSDEWELLVGDQFRALRIRADLEQTELAALASISVGALKNLEGGRVHRSKQLSRFQEFSVALTG